MSVETKKSGMKIRSHLFMICFISIFFIVILSFAMMGWGGPFFGNNTDSSDDHDNGGLIKSNNDISLTQIIEDNSLINWSYDTRIIDYSSKDFPEEYGRIPDLPYTPFQGAFLLADDSIELTVYEFTHPGVAHDLLKAHDRGVNITITVESPRPGIMTPDQVALLYWLNRSGISVEQVYPMEYMYTSYRFLAKDLIIDGKPYAVSSSSGGNTEKAKLEAIMQARQKDSDKLEELIIKTAIPCSILSLQVINAVTQHNQEKLIEHSDDLTSLATSALEEAEGYNVSDTYLPMKKSFTMAMNEYIKVGNTLSEGVPSTKEERVQFLVHINRGTDLLMHAFEDIRSDIRYPDEVMNHVSTLNLNTNYVVHSEALSLNERFEYLDSRKANTISVRPRSTRYLDQFWSNDPQNGIIHYVPAEGNRYLLVLVQYSHLGNHKGSHYEYTPPALNAHTLKYYDQVYTPISLPRFTSYGENYAPRSIDRREVTVGYIVYEVPIALDLSCTYLSIDVGGNIDAPIWRVE